MRPETGTIKFENNWTGIFIRGDDAFAFSIALKHILKECQETDDLSDILAIKQIENIIDLLESSNEGNLKFKDEEVQKLKDFQKCKIEKEEYNAKIN